MADVNDAQAASASLRAPATADPPRRAVSADNRRTAKRFFSAYAETWIGLSPLWLMGEALAPGQKVGTRFSKGKNHLLAAAHDVRRAVTDSAQDVVVIVDDKLRGGQTQTSKTAEVIKAAGENVLLVVTTSLDKVQAELRRKDYGPEIKNSVNKHGRDVVVILDRALKHPVVITGVSRFAASKGIPHADALLRLGSLALSRILRAMPEDAREQAKEEVEEIDAAELERTSSMEEKEQATEIGKDAERSSGHARVEDVHGKDPFDRMRKRTECVVM